MDNDLSDAVREVFVRLHQEGLIYRGERLDQLVSTSPRPFRTLKLSMNKLRESFYYIRYPLADGSDRHLVVATTRPETLLGDTAVAVHPEDPRFHDS
ncbi:MAG: class I tRNA ligase family protein [Nitrospirales bacterium]|nr:class I tRNA ligase family protein [Nitrospirales bacterium]